MSYRSEWIPDSTVNQLMELSQIHSTSNLGIDTKKRVTNEIYLLLDANKLRLEILFYHSDRYGYHFTDSQKLKIMNALSDLGDQIQVEFLPFQWVIFKVKINLRPSKRLCLIKISPSRGNKRILSSAKAQVFSSPQKEWVLIPSFSSDLIPRTHYQGIGVSPLNIPCAKWRKVVKVYDPWILKSNYLRFFSFAYSQFWNNKYFLFQRLKSTSNLILPQTYLDYDSFLSHFESGKSYFCKIAGKERGTGVFVIRSLSQAKLIQETEVQDLQAVWQVGVEPQLFEGRKFDFRCYLLVSWLRDEPLVYVYKDAGVRIAKNKYHPKSSDKETMLTNTSIGSEIQSSRDSFPNYPSKKIRLALLDFAFQMREKIQKSCFLLLGVDLLLGQDGQIYFLECNSFPSLYSDDERWEGEKTKMLFGALSVLTGDGPLYRWSRPFRLKDIQRS